MNKPSSYLDTLNQVFDEAGSPSKDKVLGLMDETMSFFREIKAKLESDDPAKQKEAYEETMEMKRLLEVKMQALSQRTGLDLSQLAAFAEDPSNLSPEEQSALEEAKSRLQKFQEETI